jgi:hypothetical protein
MAASGGPVLPGVLWAIAADPLSPARMAMDACALVSVNVAGLALGVSM